MVLVFPLLLLSLPPGYRGGITGTLDRAGFVYVRLVPTVRAVAYVAGLPAFLLELRIQSTWKTCYGRKVQHTVDLGSRGSRRTQRKQEVLREVETFPPREVTHDSPPRDEQQRPPPADEDGCSDFVSGGRKQEQPSETPQSFTLNNMIFCWFSFPGDNIDILLSMESWIHKLSPDLVTPQWVGD